MNLHKTHPLVYRVDLDILKIYVVLRRFDTSLYKILKYVKMAAVVGKLMQAQIPMVLEKVTPQIEAKLQSSWKQLGSEAVMSQIPTLIESAAPQIESVLRSQLRTMSPEKAALFLQNWKRLDAVVQQELGRGYGGRRKTRRRKSRK